MSIRTIRFPAALTLSLALVACDSELAIPTDGDVFLAGDESVYVGDNAVVEEKVCATVDFSGFAHGDALDMFSVPLNGGFDLTVTTTAGGSDSQDQARIFDSAGGVPAEDFDLLNPDAGTCVDCDGNIVVISDQDFENRGDSPDGGVIKITGFPGVGYTTIKSFSAIDQQDQDGLLESISLEIDGVMTGASSMLGESTVETVDATEIPVASMAEFIFVGSGAIDDIEMCYVPERHDNPGTGTIGYWKNHPEAWPVNAIKVGGVDYTRDAAIDWMKTAGKGDKTIDLFKQLVAAKLNVILGNDSSCVQDQIDDADTWLMSWPLGSDVSADSDAWQSGGGGALHSHLTDYNEGKLCAPHRD